MQILFFQKNKLLFKKFLNLFNIKKIFSTHKNTDTGFSLLECILAVGILSIVLASLIGLQSSLVYIAQNNNDKLRAIWAMQQAYSQVEYLLDVSGHNDLPEKASFMWPGDNRFNVTVTKIDLKEIKLSQFLITALKFNNLAHPEQGENLNVATAIAPIALILDNTPISQNLSIYTKPPSTPKINKTNFINLFIKVEWESGSEKKFFENGFFLIDNNTLSNLKLPSDNNGSNSDNPNGKNNNNNNPNENKKPNG